METAFHKKMTAIDTERTAVCLFPAGARVCSVLLLLSLCFLHCLRHSDCAIMVTPSHVAADGATFRIESLSSHRQLENRTLKAGQSLGIRNSEDLNIVENDLLLVTVLKSCPQDRGHLTFYVDDTLLYLTVAVRGRTADVCVLSDPFGTRVEVTSSSHNGTQWTVHTPTVGQWNLLQKSEGPYDITVQGASILDVEVTLYDIDVSTGLDTIVHDSPTAGHQIRAIIDVIGSGAISTLYNMSLVTSEGEELAYNWLRPSGEPQDPQFFSSITWPSQAVYIRVYGGERAGGVFQRQTPFLITPVLFDLILQEGQSSGVIGPSGTQVVRYQLINHGPSGTFELTSSIDNDAFSAVVSPRSIRLGQLGSFVGTIRVTAPRFSSSHSGLLRVSVWRSDDPAVLQSANLLLTSTVTITDPDPPTCLTLTLTGNCTQHDVTSPTCQRRHWKVRASVEDEVSGLSLLKFADVSAKDSFLVPSFPQGSVQQAVIVFFRASCCRDKVVLETKDMAGNARLCQFFQAEISPELSLSITTTTTTTTNNTTIIPTTITPTTTSITTSTTLPLLSHSTSTPRALSSSTTSTSSSSFSSSYSSSSTQYVPRKPVSVSSSSSGSRTEGQGSEGATTELLSLGQSGVTYLVPVGVSTVVTSLPLAPRNSTLVLWDVITSKRKAMRYKADYSSLKTTSIVLGSIGGFAGLCIALLCLVLVCRHRRLIRQHRHSSCHSQDSSNSSSISSSDNRSHHHHHHHDRHHRDAISNYSQDCNHNPHRTSSRDSCQHNRRVGDHRQVPHIDCSHGESSYPQHPQCSYRVEFRPPSQHSHHPSRDISSSESSPRFCGSGHGSDCCRDVMPDVVPETISSPITEFSTSL